MLIGTACFECTIMKMGRGSAKCSLYLPIYFNIILVIYQLKSGCSTAQLFLIADRCIPLTVNRWDSLPCQILRYVLSVLERNLLFQLCILFRLVAFARLPVSQSSKSLCFAFTSKSSTGNSSTLLPDDLLMYLEVEEFVYTLQCFAIDHMPKSVGV